MNRTIRGAGVAIAALLMSTGAVRAGDAPAAKPAVDPKPQLERLKARATEWLNARKGLVVKCWNCEGTGVLRQLAGGGRVVTRPCSACTGKGKRYSKELGRKVLHDMRSPAWRARATAQDEAGKAFAAWKIDDAAVVAPKSWRWDRAELVDETHGIAYAFEGDDPGVKSSRWILVIDAGRSSTWYLWTEVADGPWPAPDPTLAPELTPIPKLRGIILDGAIAKTAAVNRPASKGEDGRALVLVLEPPEKGPPRASSLETVRSDAIAYVRGIWGSMPTDYESIRLTFMATWQDQFGERKRMPAWQVAMDADVFQRIRWENLSDAQAFRLFRATQEQHEGWQIVTR